MKFWNENTTFRKSLFSILFCLIFPSIFHWNLTVISYIFLYSLCTHLLVMAVRCSGWALEGLAANMSFDSIPDSGSCCRLDVFILPLGSPINGYVGNPSYSFVFSSAMLLQIQWAGNERRDHHQLQFVSWILSLPTVSLSMLLSVILHLYLPISIFVS